MKTKTLTTIMFLTIISLTSVYAQGLSLPHQFYGNAIYNGDPANNILIEAYIDGEIIESENTINGFYGGEEGSQTFIVKDNEGINQGKEVVFYINGVNTGQTYLFENGGITKLDLTANGPRVDKKTSGGSGGGGGGGSTTTTSEVIEEENLVLEQETNNEESTEATGNDVKEEIKESNEESRNFFSFITGAAIGSGNNNLWWIAIIVIIIIILLFFLVFKKKKNFETYP